MIEEWTNVVLDDFDVATQIFKDEQNVEVLNHGSGSDPLSYQEMAEDFRVFTPPISDIRYSKEVLSIS
eukprot:scaffold6180_cov202-Chaetoceros_neogracile.AAC.1